MERAAEEIRNHLFVTFEYIMYALRTRVIAVAANRIVLLCFTTLKFV
jgi:hypothetical protein